MGLDMYLERSIYVGAQYEHRNVEANVDIKVDGRKLQINTNKIAAIIEHVGYWRKANAIHGWFVDNIGDGEDDCRRMYVPIERLKELFVLCKAVLKDKSLAESNLPTKSGFFFGSYDYDSYYFQDIEYTMDLLDEVLNSHTDDAEYYYQASW